MPRKTCLDCVRKHLGQAHVLFDEFLSGDYNSHFWLAVGHMAEAESESVQDYPEIADMIREERCKAMSEEEYLPDILEVPQIGSSHGVDKPQMQGIKPEMASRWQSSHPRDHTDIVICEMISQENIEKIGYHPEKFRLKRIENKLTARRTLKKQDLKQLQDEYLSLTAMLK